MSSQCVSVTYLGFLYMSQKMANMDFVRMQIRLPSDVDAWLKARAREDSRSKNSMLVMLLREAMRREEKENAPTGCSQRGAETK